MADSSDSSPLGIRPYAAGSPWVFKGRAMYQLQLVRAEVARNLIPKELKLVEAFGHTLGGFFVAHYDDSPAGQFHEAVIIPGIVWNPPTSCAWAGRVLVSSEEARDHGRNEVGLPSHGAHFSHSVQDVAPPSRWWNALPWSKGKVTSRHSVEIVEKNGALRIPLCSMAGIPPALMSSSSSPPTQQQRWMGPAVQLYLPNFSGKTREQPNLLKYSCRLNCRVSAVPAVKITPLSGDSSSQETRDMLAVLTGKPLVSIFFDDMVMSVAAPQVLDLKKAGEDQGASTSVPAGPIAAAS